jgi:hypothetical protein
MEANLRVASIIGKRSFKEAQQLQLELAHFMQGRTQKQKGLLAEGIAVKYSSCNLNLGIWMAEPKSNEGTWQKKLLQKHPEQVAVNQACVEELGQGMGSET